MKIPMGAGRVVARSYIAFDRSIGLELFAWRNGGWRCAVKILADHGTNLSVCINGYYSENHLIVEKITDDVITGDRRGYSSVV